MKDHNNLLLKNQSGFQSSNSTINQLTETYNIIISNLDKGKDIMVIFCDISKTFYKVWHKCLIYKLQKYGIRGEILGWIKIILPIEHKRLLWRAIPQKLKALMLEYPRD